MRRGEVELIGAPSVDWLGVPLKSGTTCIGVVVVQSYNQNARFEERDREILKFVSQQLAAAIEHKRYEEALRRSEARSRSSDSERRLRHLPLHRRAEDSST